MSLDTHVRLARGRLEGLRGDLGGDGLVDEIQYPISQVNLVQFTNGVFKPIGGPDRRPRASNRRRTQ